MLIAVGQSVFKREIWMKISKPWTKVKIANVCRFEFAHTFCLALSIHVFCRSLKASWWKFMWTQYAFWGACNVQEFLCLQICGSVGKICFTSWQVMSIHRSIDWQKASIDSRFPLFLQFGRWASWNQIQPQREVSGHLFVSIDQCTIISWTTEIASSWSAGAYNLGFKVLCLFLESNLSRTGDTFMYVYVQLHIYHSQIFLHFSIQERITWRRNQQKRQGKVRQSKVLG